MAARTLSLLAIVLALVLAPACAKSRPVVQPEPVIKTVRVEVPVAVPLQPPAELAAPFVPVALPQFVAPTDPRASSALTSDGERQLQQLIDGLLTRIAAWRALAGLDPQP